MNPDSPQTPREALETRITALLLGELSSAEAAALREVIQHDAALAALHDRLKRTIELVRETVAASAGPASESAAPLKLSEERRRKLLSHFKTVKSREAIRPKDFVTPRHRPMSWLVPVAAAAVFMAVIGVVVLVMEMQSRFTLMSDIGGDQGREAESLAEATAVIAGPDSTRARSSSQANTIINNLRQLDGAKQQWAMENRKSAADVPTFDDIAPYMGRGSELPPPVAGETYSLGKVGDSPTAELNRRGRIQHFTLSEDGGLTVEEKRGDGRRLAALSRREPDANSQKLAFASTPAPARPGRTEIVLPSSGEPAETSVVLAPKGPEDKLGLDLAGTSGGGGAGGSKVVFAGRGQPPERLAKADTEKVPLYYAWSAAESGVVATNGTVTTFSGRRSPPVAFGAGTLGPAGGTHIAGTTVNDGKLALDQLGFEQQKSDSFEVGGDVIPEGGRIAPQAEVYSHTVVGYVDTSAKSRRAADIAVKEAVRRQSSSIVLPPTEPKAEELAAIKSIVATRGHAGVADSKAARQLEEVGQQVAQVAGDLDRLRRDLNISESDAAGTAPAPMLEQATLQRLESLRIEAETRYLGREKLLSSLKPLGRDELRKVVPTAAPDRQLNTLLEQLRDAEQKLATLKKDQSTDRTEVATTAAQVENLNQKINDRIEGILVGLEKTVESAKAERAKLKEEVEKARQADQKKAEEQRAYLAKNRELEELIRLRSRLAMKIMAERTDVDLPKSSVVQIVDRAQPAQSKTLWQRLTGTAESVARIKLDRDVSDIEPTSGRTYQQGAYDPYFIQTEFEVIQSQPVLNKVIEKLNLNETWASKRGTAGKLTTKETLQLLKKSLNLRPVRSTSLVDIGVKSDNPDEAARIANAIAETYRDYRLEQRRELTLGGIKILKEQFGEQDKKIARAQKELERLQGELDVEQADVAVRRPATNAPIPQPEIQTADNAFSTFSLNVSDVSLKLAAASLEKGQMPDPASIRSEEFINAFDYRDPEPPPGVPIAFAWERARYPFAHNRDLLRFSLKTAAAGRQPGRPLNLVLLLDNSGSMERADRVRIIHEALRVLAAQLQPQDKFSVVTFARTPRLWVDGVSGDKAVEIVEEVSGVTPQGGTNLEEAMNLAYATALRHYLANGVNRVVVLTDGAANLGNVDPDALKQKVEAHRRQGVALDCFGIGWEGYNDDLLEVLSRNGDGRYGFVNTPGEAATEFAGQLAGALKVAASDVKVQVEFNPKRVTAYRQIGYAKHQLTKEQFRDNTVDAAEIAAAESGNALYTVEVNPAGEGPLCTVRVRYRVPGTADYREHEWAVPYTGNAVALEQASPAMRLAATASAFSEWLVASPFAAEVTLDRLLGWLSGVPEVYGADARPKKLEWMIRQAKAISGQ